MELKCTFQVHMKSITDALRGMNYVSFAFI